MGCSEFTVGRRPADEPTLSDREDDALSDASVVRNCAVVVFESVVVVALVDLLALILAPFDEANSVSNIKVLNTFLLQGDGYCQKDNGAWRPPINRCLWCDALMSGVSTRPPQRSIMSPHPNWRNEDDDDESEKIQTTCVADLKECGLPFNIRRNRFGMLMSFTIGLVL